MLELDHVQLAAPPGCEPEARRFFGELLCLEEIEKPVAPARKAHPALRATAGEIDELAERLASAGATVEWDERCPGVRRFFTRDRWGNRLEVLG